MARQAKAAAVRRKGGPSGRAIGTGLFMVPVIGLLLPTCAVLAVSMAPTIVAWIVDRSRERCLTITVGLLNLCGTFPAVADLWGRGQTVRAGLDVASDPFHWLIAYGAAAIGWGIYLGLPSILASYYTMTTERRLHALRARQAALVAAWGEEVAAAEPGAEGER